MGESEASQGQGTGSRMGTGTWGAGQEWESRSRMGTQGQVWGCEDGGIWRSMGMRASETGWGQRHGAQDRDK